MRQAKALSMVIFFLLAASLLSSGFLLSASETEPAGGLPVIAESLVRIPVEEGEPAWWGNYEVVGGRPGQWVDLIVSPGERDRLAAGGKMFTVLLEDVAAHSRQVAGDYHSLAEMEEALQEIAALYPDIASLYSIGTSYEDRPIWCLEITDNPGEDEGEPGVLFMGLHHAREWPTVEICLYTAQMLTAQYAVSAQIRELVQSRRIWIVPCVNPDGYFYSHDQGNDWRKNRHYFPETDTYGVDLNRNYPGSCNGDPRGAWGSLGSASVTHNPAYSTYCGPAPFSEREARAVRSLFLEHNVSASITWHTYGELVLWPWGYSEDVQAPSDDHLSRLGREMASRIASQSGSGTYTPEQAAGLYPTTGDTADWAYGYAHYVQGTTTFTYTIEACREFHPPADTLDQIVSENFHAALFLLEEAENISQLPPRALPPVIADMSSDPDGEYTVFWEERNPAAGVSHFQLDELSGLEWVIDHAEADRSYWALDGFSVTSSRYHSPDGSYGAPLGNEEIAAMTTVQPVPVSEGQELAFWCWYDIEEGWDYAFVEVSRDGRCYEVVDSFTGRSDQWEYRTYSLDGYAQDSVFIRFRYTTDSRTTGQGFFVDDISPVADFASVSTLDASISDSHYDIADRDQGIYYYRVRGYSQPHGWGDFSVLKKMRVGEADNAPPEPPSISGPGRGKIGRAYDYVFRSSDPEGGSIYYFVDWGDGSDSGWLGPYPSGDNITVSHTWAEQGTYHVRAQARDQEGIQSPWGVLQVSMPRARLLPLYEGLVQMLCAALSSWLYPWLGPNM